MLTGKMWQFQHGTRKELINVYYYLKGTYPLTGEVYARHGSFGVREDKSLQEGVWLFAVDAHQEFDERPTEPNKK